MLLRAGHHRINAGLGERGAVQVCQLGPQYVGVVPAQRTVRSLPKSREYPARTVSSALCRARTTARGVTDSQRSSAVRRPSQHAAQRAAMCAPSLSVGFWCGSTGYARWTMRGRHETTTDDTCGIGGLLCEEKRSPPSVRGAPCQAGMVRIFSAAHHWHSGCGGGNHACACC